jgi:uncharacterized membrane protein SirB2
MFKSFIVILAIVLGIFTFIDMLVNPKDTRFDVYFMIGCGVVVIIIAIFTLATMENWDVDDSE